MRYLYNAPVFVLILALLVACGFAWHRGSEVDRLRAEAVADSVAAALVVDSLEAASDSTRTHLSDSLALAEQRAVQAEIDEQRSDSILRSTSAALARAHARVASLEATLTSAPTETDTGDVRVAAFEEYRPPYRVRAAVRLPPPPEPGTVALAITLDSIPITLGVHCSNAPGSGGARQARVSAETPPWASLRFERVQVDPDVCNPVPPPAQRGPSTLRAAALGGGVVAVLLSILALLVD